MDVCSKIFQINEIDNYEDNEIISEIVLNQFVEQVGYIFFFSNSQSFCKNLEELKHEFIYTSEYVDMFFEILKRYNYNMKKELKNAMFYLGHLENPNNNKKIIKRLLNSPVIKDISFNGKNMFTILSEQYGDFTFELASYYFRNNQNMIDYISETELPNNCHYHTFCISQIFNQFYAVTSLCKSIFTGTYYHSYTLNKDNNTIIDLCYNAVVDKDDYYHIFEPKEISVILNSKVEEELKLALDNTAQPTDRCRLLKIALYKQYLSILKQDKLSQKVYKKELI